MALHELLYTSASEDDMRTDELVELLEKARAKNERLGVTGMLLYHRREFMQILEGEKETVLSLYDVIARDPRHTGVRIFYDGALEERGFSQWSMAFTDLQDVDLSNLEGYEDLSGNGFSSSPLTENPTLAKTLFAKLRSQVA